MTNIMANEMCTFKPIKIYNFPGAHSNEKTVCLDKKMFKAIFKYIHELIINIDTHNSNKILDFEQSNRSITTSEAFMSVLSLDQYAHNHIVPLHAYGMQSV